MLDDVMKAKHITSKALADMTGISKRTIESYRANRFEPSLSVGLKIADALKVDPHELIKEVDNEEISLF